MEVEINAILFHSYKNIEIVPIKVIESNYKIVLKKLTSEREKIINYLKSLQSKGSIKSIFRPKNKQMQKELNELCKLKKEVKKNIDKIKTIYQ